MHLSFSFTGWGHPEEGCADNSDKVKDANPDDTSNPCGGDDFTYFDRGKDKKWIKKNATAKWAWFHCKVNGKCIPSHLR